MDELRDRFKQRHALRRVDAAPPLQRRQRGRGWRLAESLVPISKTLPLAFGPSRARANLERFGIDLGPSIELMPPQIYMSFPTCGRTPRWYDRQRWPAGRDHRARVPCVYAAREHRAPHHRRRRHQRAGRRRATARDPARHGGHRRTRQAIPTTGTVGWGMRRGGSWVLAGNSRPESDRPVQNLRRIVGLSPWLSMRLRAGPT